MNLIKKNTYEQHDNEQGSFYKNIVKLEGWGNLSVENLKYSINQ